MWSIQFCILPKGGGAVASSATIYKGNGTVCDEPTRSQVTARFGKGPGSTKAVPYGKKGATKKKALEAGEDWLCMKRSERDRLLKKK